MSCAITFFLHGGRKSGKWGSRGPFYTFPCCVRKSDFFFGSLFFLRKCGAAVVKKLPDYLGIVKRGERE